jgi:hypothetical protein
MKFYQKLLVMATLVTLVTTSCKKNKAEIIDEVKTTFELSSDQAIADNLTQDVNDVLTEATMDNNLIGGRPNEILQTTGTLSCATITVTGNFPTKNILIDFGANGCTSNNGVTRKGKVNVVLTDSLRKPGSVATVTFDAYYVNNFKIEGTNTWTNTTVLNSGTRSWNRVVTNGKITSPTGKYWLHTSNVDLVQNAGALTPFNLLDDVYQISGIRTVTNDAGKTRSCTTQTPLQKKTICNNIDQGILKVQGPNHFALIDFGNGTCDNIATVSIDGNTPITVTLR